jgi:hypothetical protein
MIRNLVGGDSSRTGSGRHRSSAPLERETPFVLFKVFQFSRKRAFFLL